MPREAACLQLAERQFQSFKPLNEIDLLSFSVILGNLRSVDILRSLCVVTGDFNNYKRLLRDI